MKTISLHTARELLANLPPGAHPVGFIALTEVDVRRKNNPFSRVMKWSRVNAMICVDHVAAVMRQQAREGVPEPHYLGAPRSWGGKVGNGALVNHLDRWYLAAQLNPIIRPRPLYLVPNEETGRLRVVSKETVAPWLPPERDQRAHQGVEREVVRRDYRLDHIVQLSMNTERYRIRHD